MWWLKYVQLLQANLNTEQMKIFGGLLKLFLRTGPKSVLEFGMCWH